jgi:hypothetical protein
MTLQMLDPNRLNDWKRRVLTLMDELAGWGTAAGWSVQRTEKRLNEQRVGEYMLPALHMRTPDGELYVTPVALDVMGADGRVDVEAWPSLNRVRLIGVGTPPSWLIMTDSNVPLRQPWNSQTFVELVKDLQK